MTTLILAGLVLLQLNGVVEGTVHDESGRLRAGIRVAAVAPSDPGVLVRNTRTDQDGSYRLEVPPGRYQIIAGRIECPAYYPGTTDSKMAAEVEVSVRGASFTADLTASNESLYEPSILFKSQPCRDAQKAWPPLLRAFLSGAMHSTPRERTIFTLDSRGGNGLEFTTSSRTLKSDCLNCSFLLTEKGIVPPAPTTSGILFKVANDSSFEMTCQAQNCHVVTVATTGATKAVKMDRQDSLEIDLSSYTAFGTVQ